MIIKSLDGGIFLKATDTATDMKLQVLESDEITPVDLATKVVEVVIGTDVGRVLVKTPTFQNELGHVYFGLDNDDLIISGEYHLEVHISEGSERRVAPSRGFYKLRLTKAIDDLQAEVTTVTLEYLMGEIDRRAIQGIQGPIGLQGIQGPIGIQGIKGNQGNTGPQGLTGPIGLTGPKGDQGIQGIQGIKGDAGSQGLKGDIGLTGAKGDTGIQGIQGPKGSVGSQGETGPKGDKGDQGLQGIQGFKGEAGTSFTVDATGTTVGRSAYDSSPVGFAYLATDAGNLYLRQGASGWSPAIPFGKGEQGDQGIQGIQGPKGDTGLQGLTGPKGDVGDTGLQGIQGPQGLKGDIGLTGSQGETGLKGDTGLQGPKGETGEQGPQGEIGEAGTTSWNGITDKPNDLETTGGAQTKVNTHANLKTNPHEVTAAQVGAYTTTEVDNKLSAKQDSLPVENRRKITFGTTDPTGGIDGDIYFQYE